MSRLAFRIDKIAPVSTHDPREIAAVIGAVLVGLLLWVALIYAGVWLLSLV